MLVPWSRRRLLRRFPAPREGGRDTRGRRRARAPSRWPATSCPSATFTYLYHTVSAVTLLRTGGSQNGPDTPSEQRQVVDAMIGAVPGHTPASSRSRSARDDAGAFPERLAPPPRSTGRTRVRRAIRRPARRARSRCWSTATPRNEALVARTPCARCSESRARSPRRLRGHRPRHRPGTQPGTWARR